MKGEIMATYILPKEPNVVNYFEEFVPEPVKSGTTQSDDCIERFPPAKSWEQCSAEHEELSRIYAKPLYKY